MAAGTTYSHLFQKTTPKHGTRGHSSGDASSSTVLCSSKGCNAQLREEQTENQELYTALQTSNSHTGSNEEGEDGGQASQPLNMLGTVHIRDE